MAQTFEEQMSSYSQTMAEMVYSKFVQESYHIRACSSDYDKGKMDTYKLRYALASYGQTCEKLNKCITNYTKKVTCVPVATPVPEESPCVCTDKICNQVFEQLVPATIWTIPLELDFMPNVTTVTVINGNEVEIKGAISYDEANKKVIVEFSHAVSGKAFLS